MLSKNAQSRPRHFRIVHLLRYQTPSSHCEACWSFFSVFCIPYTRTFHFCSAVDLPIAMAPDFLLHTHQPRTIAHQIPRTSIGLPRLSNLSARLRFSVPRRLNRDAASQRLYVARQALKIKIDMFQLPPERKIQRLNPLFAKDEESPIPIPSLPHVATHLSESMATTLARPSPLRNDQEQPAPSHEGDSGQDFSDSHEWNSSSDAARLKHLPGSAVRREQSPQPNRPAIATFTKDQSSLRLQQLRAKLGRITQRISGQQVQES